MKKILLFIVVVFGALFLVGCDGDTIYDDKEIRDYIVELEEKNELLESKIKILEDYNKNLELLIEENDIEKEKFQELIDELYSKRYVEFNKETIVHIQYYNYTDGQIIYSVNSNSNLKRIYMDLWELKICLEYKNGGTDKLDYIRCIINYKK